MNTTITIKRHAGVQQVKDLKCHSSHMEMLDITAALHAHTHTHIQIAEGKHSLLNSRVYMDLVMRGGLSGFISCFTAAPWLNG